MAKKILNDARVAKAGDVMTKYVFYIDGDKSVADAIKIMKRESLSSLVVNGRTPDDPWGIITRKDVVTKIIGPGKDPKKIKIFEIMSKPLVTVPPDFALKDCAQLMHNKGIRRVAVFDGKAIVGLLSNPFRGWPFGPDHTRLAPQPQKRTAFPLSRRFCTA